MASSGVATVVIALLAVPPGKALAQEFLRGDANSDGIVSISDILTIRRFLFIGGLVLPCMDAADADDGQPVDGCNCNPKSGVTISDAIALLRYLFMQDAWASILPEPFPIPGVDPTPDDADCASYEVVPPSETSDVIRVGEVEAAPGDDVEIPIYLSNSVDVEAIQLVIDYDPAVLTPVDGNGGINFSGTVYEQIGDPAQNGGFALVKGHTEAGVLVAGIVGSLINEGFEVPPGEDALVAKIRGHVSESAQGGTTLQLIPTNGLAGDGTGPYHLRNELTSRGSARFATLRPRLIPGFLKIIGPDGMDFLRGDSNGDGAFDLSDAVYTLVYLFSHGAAPACPDAADTNDDGLLDISDPVAGLNFLFAPSALATPLSAPLGVCGTDEERDDLGSCASTACP